MTEAVRHLLAKKGYRLEATKAARECLADVGYDPDFGARPLKRTIQRKLQDPLELKNLSGKFHECETIKVDRGEEVLTFTVDVLVVEGEVVEAYNKIWQRTPRAGKFPGRRAFLYLPGIFPLTMPARTSSSHLCYASAAKP